jgi:hypothetical protein
MEPLSVRRGFMKLEMMRRMDLEDHEVAERAIPGEGLRESKRESAHLSSL